MKKQELSEKELSKVCGGALAAGDKKLFDGGTVTVDLEPKLEVSWKNLGQIR